MLSSLTILREDLIAFLEMGGDVMPGIFMTTFVMWVLIAERYAYLYFSHRTEADDLLAQWRGRAERDSWFADDDFPYAETWWWSYSELEIKNQWILDFLRSVSTTQEDQTFQLGFRGDQLDNSRMS